MGQGQHYPTSDAKQYADRLVNVESAPVELFFDSDGRGGVKKFRRKVVLDSLFVGGMLEEGNPDSPFTARDRLMAGKMYKTHYQLYTYQTAKAQNYQPVSTSGVGSHTSPIEDKLAGTSLFLQARKSVPKEFLRPLEQVVLRNEWLYYPYKREGISANTQKGLNRSQFILLNMALDRLCEFYAEYLINSL